jgi:hypothetical protein
MSIKGTVDEVIKTPMSRREFLWHVGAGILALIGVSGFLKALQGTQAGNSAAKGGYGDSTYGGRAKNGRL